MAGDEFFDEPKEQSLVKSEIVRKYFWAWAKIIAPRARRMGKKVGYVDLFCGPGRYGDGTPSTPLLILDTVLRDPMMCEVMAIWFNDRNPDFADALRREIAAYPGIERLALPPRVTNITVGNEVAAKLKKTDIPMLVFVDPWGYKGLSLELIDSALSGWGSECIFFFNYNRINAALTNPVFRENMVSLFGMHLADIMADHLTLMSPDARERAVLQAISQALNMGGKRYVLPFPFKPTAKTSHHLIFVTKNVKGYDIMKQVMWKMSSSAPMGFADFEFNAAQIDQPLLFGLGLTIDDLSRLLLTDFTGRTLTMREIYEHHHVGRPFVEPNYKQALTEMEASTLVVADPPAAARRPNTFGPNVKVSFPPKPRR